MSSKKKILKTGEDFIDILGKNKLTNEEALTAVILLLRTLKINGINSMRFIEDKKRFGEEFDDLVKKEIIVEVN